MAYSDALEVYNQKVKEYLAIDRTLTSFGDDITADRKSELSLSLALKSQEVEIAFNALEEEYLATFYSTDEAVKTAIRNLGYETLPSPFLNTNNQDDPNRVNQEFQGLRFYDGTSFGYLRLFKDRVELVVNPSQEEESISYALDGTQSHVFRLVAQNKDIVLYVDGILAITATGKFTSKTDKKLIEFGDIAGLNEQGGSRWDSVKYSTTGEHPPAEDASVNLDEVLILSGGSIGNLKAYRNGLYVSYDPYDTNKSSKIYRVAPGSTYDRRGTVAITKANIRAITVDPNKASNEFGTSGKFLGTDRGLQYLYGGKPSPWNIETKMSDLPENLDDWNPNTNADGFSRSVFNETLTIDTTQESGEKFMSYVMDEQTDQWNGSDNAKGWTVEARVRIVNDGTSSLAANSDEEADFAAASAGAKEVVLVIEESQLMTSPEREIAIQTATAILLTLKRWDKFNIVFSRYINNQTIPYENLSDSRLYRSTFVTATKANVAEAVAFITGMDQAETCNWLPDASSGLKTALSLGYETANKYAFYIGTGFSYYGIRDVTDPTSYIYGTPAIDPSINGQTVLNQVQASNTANVKIMTVGIGSAMDSPESKLTVNIGGTTYIYANTGAATYQTMMETLASDSSGEDFRIRSYDNLTEKIKAVIQSVDPDFIDPSGDVAVTGAYSGGTTATIVNQDGSCEQVSVNVVSNSVPEDDGLNAPGIVINDGTYQEVVNFFQNGIRLKYAKIFARFDMSSKFVDVRIIGRGQAIAVFVKQIGEAAWQRVIHAPNGLFVKFQQSGAEQETPLTAVDGLGSIHLVWQDSRDDEFHIYHSKTAPKKIFSKGSGLFGAKKLPNWNVLDARQTLGLPPVQVTDAIKSASNILVIPTGLLQTQGVGPNDNIYVSDKAAVNPVYRKFQIKSVINDAVLEVISTEDASKLFVGADYVIASSDETTVPPFRVDEQAISSNSPAVIVSSTDKVFVSYANFETQTGEIFVRSGFNGVTSVQWLGSTKVSDDANSFAPALAESSTGDLVVAWLSGPNDNPAIAYSVWSLDQGVLKNKVNVKKIPGTIKPRKVSVAPAASNSMIIVFEDVDQTSGLSRIYCTELDKDYAFVSTIEVSTDVEGNNTNPSVGSSTTRTATYIDYKAVVAWENDDTGLKEIITSVYGERDLLPDPVVDDDDDEDNGDVEVPGITITDCEGDTADRLTLYFTQTAGELLLPENAGGPTGDYVCYQLSSTPQTGDISWRFGSNLGQSAINVPTLPCGQPAPTVNGNICPKFPKLVFTYNIVGPAEVKIPAGNWYIGAFRSSYAKRKDLDGTLVDESIYGTKLKKAFMTVRTDPLIQRAILGSTKATGILGSGLAFGGYPKNFGEFLIGGTTPPSGGSHIPADLVPFPTNADTDLVRVGEPLVLKNSKCKKITVESGAKITLLQIEIVPGAQLFEYNYYEFLMSLEFSFVTLDNRTDVKTETITRKIMPWGYDDIYNVISPP